MASVAVGGIVLNDLKPSEGGGNSPKPLLQYRH